jgi:hypothetical protein
MLVGNNELTTMKNVGKLCSNSGLNSQSHWMPLSVECLRHNALAAAMVDKFE